MAKRWYVVHTYSGYENKVKEKKGVVVLTGLVRKDNVSSSTMFLNSNFKPSEKDFILYLKDI